VGNIVGKIEVLLISPIIGRYLLATVGSPVLYSKPPANRVFANNCQQCGLDLDCIQFERVVQVKN